MITIQQPYNNKSLWVVILLLAIISVLASCSTAKELLDKAEKKDPAIVATYARDKYPCTDLLKPDTATIWRDSTVYIECPDSIPATYETVRYDTVNNTITRVVKVPVTIRTAGQVITRWYEDSAKLKLYRLQVEGLQSDTANYRKQMHKLTGKVSTRNKWLLWLLVVVVCETLWILRKHILKLFKLFI